MKSEKYETSKFKMVVPYIPGNYTVYYTARPLSCCLKSYIGCQLEIVLKMEIEWLFSGAITLSCAYDQMRPVCLSSVALVIAWIACKWLWHETVTLTVKPLLISYKLWLLLVLLMCALFSQSRGWCLLIPLGSFLFLKRQFVWAAARSQTINTTGAGDDTAMQIQQQT